MYNMSHACDVLMQIKGHQLINVCNINVYIEALLIDGALCTLECNNVHTIYPLQFSTLEAIVYP